MDLRAKSKITEVFNGTEDHGIHVIWITVDGDGVQGFGGICFDDGESELEKDFIKSVCGVFGVKKLDDLVGKECYALRCFEEMHTPIEALEAPSGKRFVLTAWRKKHFPETKDPLTGKRESIEGNISFLQRRVAEEKTRLAHLDNKYHEWI
jgi:hypothetical protein